MYWISMHLLGLVIQMLVCTWDTAALWPQGIAVQSRWPSLCAQMLADPLCHGPVAHQHEDAVLACC